MSITKKQNDILDNVLETCPVLECVRTKIVEAYEVIVDCYTRRGKLLVCGNGGSAGDADHIVGELMKGFMLKRSLPEEFKNKLKQYDNGEELSRWLQTPLSAISLSSHGALITAFSNDVDFEMAFAQQVLGYGAKGDVLIAISTSGNSSNIVNAATVARAMDMNVIALTGKNPGKLQKQANIVIDVPETRTWAIQDLHSPVYHALCAMVESKFWEE